MQIAIIAGEGSLPVSIAQELTKKGTPPITYSMREDVGTLSRYSLEIVDISKPNLSFTIKDMKSRGVTHIIMAGKVSKTLVFKPSLFDLMAQKFLASLLFRDDHSLLGAIVDLFEKQGFKVIPYKDIVSDLVACEGQIAGRKPTKQELQDTKFGFEICSKLVPLSFGQSIVVHKSAVIAVEAMEGTDATILRSGGLCKGGVVTKMMRLDQDERYDIPTVGPATLQNMKEAHLTCLAVHAAHTLIVNKEEFDKLAEEYDISVIGVNPCQSL